jgi:hypothetical protein
MVKILLSGGIEMRTKAIVLILVPVFACTLLAAGGWHRATKSVAGGTETSLGPWVPGQGSIEPGGKIRGWKTNFQDVLIGPAGELASGSGPVTMNCNLDESLTGPCWGTFEFSNSKGGWEGVWEGSFNFVAGAGSYRAVGHGQGQLKGMILQNDVVYPGYAFPVNGTPGGYIYSTVTDPH